MSKLRISTLFFYGSVTKISAGVPSRAPTHVPSHSPTNGFPKGASVEEQIEWEFYHSMILFLILCACTAFCCSYWARRYGAQRKLTISGASAPWSDRGPEWAQETNRSFDSSFNSSESEQEDDDGNAYHESEMIELRNVKMAPIVVGSHVELWGISGGDAYKNGLKGTVRALRGADVVSLTLEGGSILSIRRANVRAVPRKAGPAGAAAEEDGGDCDASDDEYGVDASGRGFGDFGLSSSDLGRGASVRRRPVDDDDGDGAADDSGADEAQAELRLKRPPLTPPTKQLGAAEEGEAVEEGVFLEPGYSGVRRPSAEKPPPVTSPAERALKEKETRTELV
mmetsp:Transcript_65711/g.148276  ORF Transcript_65711/g.148276 Transcript_65711/m.148276 type:complete len:339 (+) Transcript_65711:137-1153(+)